MKWWRSAERPGYQIVDDILCPLPNANFEPYEPLSDFTPVSRRRARSEAAYATLLQLIPGRFEDWLTPGEHDLTLEGWAGGGEYDPNPDRLTTRQRTALLRWVSEHGPLGVLQHRVERVTYPPVWVHAPEGPAEEPRAQGPFSIEIERRRGEWHRWLRLSPSPTRIGASDVQDFPRTPVAERLSSAYDPSARIAPLGDWVDIGGPVTEPLADTWARFFTDVPPGGEETTTYPLLDVDAEVWMRYREPLRDFLHGAIALRDALESVAAELEAHGVAGESALAPLEQLMEPGVLQLSLMATSSQERFRGVSLLSYLAFMGREDLVAGGRPHHCEWCGAIFVSTGDRATYCSNRCRTAIVDSRRRGPSDE